jgi:hypothetical protein
MADDLKSSPLKDELKPLDPRSKDCAEVCALLRISFSYLMWMPAADLKK